MPTRKMTMTLKKRLEVAMEIIKTKQDYINLLQKEVENLKSSIERYKTTIKLRDDKITAYRDGQFHRRDIERKCLWIQSEAWSLYIRQLENGTNMKGPDADLMKMCIRHAQTMYMLIKNEYKAETEDR